MPSTTRFLSVTLILIACFGIMLIGLTDYSFWIDEGYTAWLVRDDVRAPNTLREIVRFVRDSLLNTFNHVQADVHPPLYYLLLDVWTLLIGRSEFSFRLPSALMGILGLAATYRIGKQWKHTQTGIIAMMLLCSAGFFLYYTRDARMYTLYLALTTMVIWCYSLWWRKSSILKSVILGILMTLLVFTHYTSFTVLIVLLIHLAITWQTWWRQAKSWTILLAFLIAGMIFAGWLPFILRQFEINTGFTAPGAIPSNLGTLSALRLILTNGYWWLLAIILLLSKSWLNMRQQWRFLVLIILWTLIPITILFTVNAIGLSILQYRYLIPILPAWVLLIAYFASDMRIPFIKNTQINTALSMIATGLMAFTSLQSYPILWHPKPDWRGTVQAAADAREVNEPALVYFDTRSPVTYYAEQTSLLDGISIALNWREFAPQETRAIEDSLESSSITWGMLDMQAPESWDAIAALNRNRGISYRDGNQGTIFYQFDENSTEQLKFIFATSGDNLLFEVSDYSYMRFTETIGTEICVSVTLEALQDISDNYALSVHLTRGYHEVITQTNEDLGTMAIGDSIEREFCVTKPDDDDFHLRLHIHNQQTLQRLFLLESDILWGQYLMLGTLEQLSQE